MQFVDDRGRQTASRIARAVEIEARRIETKFSRYRDTSVVSEINRNAGRTPVAVDGETDDLVRCALELTDLTGGRFDPTVGVLRRAWDFKAGKVPTGDEIDALRPLVDASAVSRRERTVFLRRAGMEIDLGGVGKEYAVDRAARLLREEGVRSAVVSFSGDVRTIGSRGDGRPWKVGVVDPRNRNRCRFAVRPLSDAGIATSGDYERGFAKDGVRYHHILDARTGWPARGVASVTVVAATAFRAGCYATASFLLGPAAGLTLLENAEDVEGALITDEGEILATSGMWLLSDLPGGVWEGCREA
ncbi:MAG TPA: FAD:protein FMN transferase [Thermoanaerobaculia bacterium]|nr:FAD:protein FMN transferase [Thermoanaerobaculia bacterium]